MDRRPAPHPCADEGFTLVEVLVVVLLIGILAAIGLTSLLGQQRKAQDVDAKSNARNLLSLVELCSTERRDARDCDSSGELQEKGLSLGTGPGEVDVSDATADTFTVVAHSRSGTRFLIARDADGHAARSCNPGGTGGCPSGGSW